MNDTMRDTAMDGGSTVLKGSTPDYRIREAEARLDRRLTALESRGGRSGWVGLFGGVALVVALMALAVGLRGSGLGDRALTVSSLSTEQVVLRDAEGIERGRLATDADGRTQLSLSDRDGRQRIRLTVLADGSPGVTISDTDDRPRAVLAYLPDGTTNLVMADAEGTGRAVFGLDPDGSARAFFADRAGTIRTLVGVEPDGRPSVSTFEGEGGGGGDDGPTR